MSSPSPEPRRWPRLLRKVVALTAALAALYLLIANAVLAAELRSSARDPRIDLQHGMAYTLIPGRVHVEDLQIGDREHGRWRVLVDRADLRVDLLRLLAGDLQVTDVWSDVRAVELGDHRLTGRIAVRAEGMRSGAAARSLRSASLDVSGGELRRIGAPAGGASLQGTVAARGVSHTGAEGLQLDGEIHLAGSDAGVLLDMARLPEAARWALEGLDRQAFTIDAAVERRGDRLTLDDLRVNSDAAEIRGAFHRRGALDQGAFLVRRGRLTTGVAIAGDRVEVVLAPDEKWLSRRLDAMVGP